MRTGQCLCGDVTITAEPFGSVQACHCTMCRTWGGGPFLSVPCKSTSFEGAVTRHASSDHAERGFCPACGTHLFFHAVKAGIYAVPLGVFDDASDLPFKAEIYVDEQPDCYAFEGARKRMTGAEFEAQFK